MSSNISRADSGIAEIVVLMIVVLVGVVSGLSDSQETTDAAAGDFCISQVASTSLLALSILVS